MVDSVSRSTRITRRSSGSGQHTSDSVLRRFVHSLNHGHRVQKNSILRYATATRGSAMRRKDVVGSDSKTLIGKNREDRRLRGGLPRCVLGVHEQNPHSSRKRMYHTPFSGQSRDCQGTAMKMKFDQRSPLREQIAKFRDQGVTVTDVSVIRSVFTPFPT